MHVGMRTARVCGQGPVGSWGEPADGSQMYGFAVSLGKEGPVRTAQLRQRLCQALFCPWLIGQHAHF